MGRVMAEPLLVLEDVRAGYGDAVVLEGAGLHVVGAAVELDDELPLRPPDVDQHARDEAHRQQ